MSVYWKQSLWLGGVYWIISLILTSVDTFETYFADFIFSLLLTIFLIPMNFLKPIKWIERLINKLPIVSTFLVFVGWVPYLSILLFLTLTIYGLSVIYSGAMNIDGVVLTLVKPLSILTVAKIACILFSFVMAAIWVFINKKSVAGCFNEKFRLIGGDSCNMPIVEEAVAEQAKKMYECKKQVAEKVKKEEKVKAVKKETKKKVKATVKDKKKSEKDNKKKTTTKKAKTSQPKAKKSA